MAWTTLGESVAGTAHIARGLPCQDAVRFARLDPAGEWLAVAVADGAGSASHADRGAALTCDGLLAGLAELDTLRRTDRESVTELFSRVRAEVIAEAERLGVRPRELACTAILAVAGPTTTLVAQLGDGAIVLGDAGGLRTAFWPEPGEYANLTDFLTDERFADVLQVDVAGPVDDLAVLTDGLQRLALDFSARVPHGPYFRPLFNELRAATDPEALVEPFRKFLDAPRVNARTDDDKSLVLAVRRP